MTSNDIFAINTWLLVTCVQWRLDGERRRTSLREIVFYVQWSLDGAEKEELCSFFFIDIIMLLDTDLYRLHNTVYVNQYLLKQP